MLSGFVSNIYDTRYYRLLESMEKMVVLLEGEGGEEVASFLQGRGVGVRVEEGGGGVDHVDEEEGK
jgi:hypothetical protein